MYQLCLVCNSKSHSSNRDLQPLGNQIIYQGGQFRLDGPGTLINFNGLGGDYSVAALYDSTFRRHDFLNSVLQEEPGKDKRSLEPCFPV